MYTNIRAFNFHGSPAPRKYFNNEHFPNYSIIHKPVVFENMCCRSSQIMQGACNINVKNSRGTNSTTYA